MGLNDAFYASASDCAIGKQIKVNRTPMPQIQCNGRAADQIIIFPELLYKRQQLDLLFCQNVFMHVAESKV